MSQKIFIAACLAAAFMFAAPGASYASCVYHPGEYDPSPDLATPGYTTCTPDAPFSQSAETQLDQNNIATGAYRKKATFLNGRAAKWPLGPTQNCRNCLRVNALNMQRISDLNK